jgi:RNA polymerase sigma-70 factor (ECF subfamily)
LPTDSGNTGARFPTTHWSEVARAGDVNPQVKRAALGRLLTAYLPALKAHVVGHHRVRADRADDLVQGFICDQVVADDLIARADRQRGRFRSFVLRALDRHVARVRRSDNAQKRNPDAPLLPLHGDEPAADRVGAADDVFDVAWAREVVQRAIRQMREECGADARAQLWHVFETCALAPLFNGTEAPAHREVMQKLAFNSAQQVSNALVTAKRLFARVLRSIVGEYAQDKEEIEAELRDLWTILARSGQSSAAASRQAM